MFLFYRFTLTVDEILCRIITLEPHHMISHGGFNQYGEVASRGNRYGDLGNFQAHLIELAVRQRGSATALAAAEQSLLAGYLETVPAPAGMGDGQLCDPAVQCRHLCVHLGCVALERHQ